jgi:hypothetical protein
MCSHPQEANIRLPKSLFGQAQASVVMTKDFMFELSHNVWCALTGDVEGMLK